MDLIYTRAMNTLIWLGDDDAADALTAVETLRLVYDRLQLSDTKLAISAAELQNRHLPAPDDIQWWTVRQCYVHGMTKGEAMSMYDLPLRDMALV
jgi:hypothetical protein